jgi:hypothetical protein
LAAQGAKAVVALVHILRPHGTASIVASGLSWATAGQGSILMTVLTIADHSAGAARLSRRSANIRKSHPAGPV